jgi:hypothetical protein
VGGGVASFAEDDSPSDKVAGLGFDGVPSAADLDEVEEVFAAHGAATQVELAHLGDPEIGALLTGRSKRALRDSASAGGAALCRYADGNVCDRVAREKSSNLRRGTRLPHRRRYGQDVLASGASLRVSEGIA